MVQGKHVVPQFELLVLKKPGKQDTDTATRGRASEPTYSTLFPWFITPVGRPGTTLLRFRPALPMAVLPPQWPDAHGGLSPLRTAL